MGHGYSMLGFLVIMILYAGIGLMAATGLVCMTRKSLSPKAEQIFYGMFLVLIAVFYLAFSAYFGATTVWRVEGIAVAAFAATGLVGARLPFFLIAGYFLHGLWDLLHELEAHGINSGFGPGQLTTIPLAYGALCAAFDVYIAVYVYVRRSKWKAAWRLASKNPVN